MINVGIIGLGDISLFHMQEYQRLKEKAKITSICDINEGLLKERGDLFKVERRYKDYRELVEDSLVDAVDILVPNSIHREVAVAAAKAGKHILLEKPIARNLEEANDIISSARKNKVKLMIAHNRRYYSTFVRAKQTMYQIGDPYLAKSEDHFYWPYQIVRSFRMKKEMLGGGILIDQGWHSIDLLRWLVGDIREVFAFSSWKGLKGLSEGEDTVLCLFKHRNEAMSQLLVSWGPGSSESNIMIYGENGMISVGKETFGLYYLPGVDEMKSSAEFPRARLVEKLETQIPDGIGGFREEIEDFLESINEDKTPPISGEEARETLRTILASYKSVEERRPIEISEIC